MEEEYLDMKMRGDASVIALWRTPEQWERSAGFGFTCLIGLQLFVRMEGARQAGEANYTKRVLESYIEELTRSQSLGHSAISQRSASFVGWCGSRREVAVSWSDVGRAKTWGVPDSGAVWATVRKG